MRTYTIPIIITVIVSHYFQEDYINFHFFQLLLTTIDRTHRQLPTIFVHSVKSN